MNLRRVLETLTSLSSPDEVPRGILEEGRIFSLGTFVFEDIPRDRVIEVVEGLGDHVGQPFGLLPWVFLYDFSTVEQDNNRKPIPIVGVVHPKAHNTAQVNVFVATPRGLRFTGASLFEHRSGGGRVKPVGTGNPDSISSGIFYPSTIAMLNTRGCSIDLVRAPKIENERRKRLSKPALPAHYKIDAGEYFTALRAPARSNEQGGTHASPIPHLRRGHERVLADGRRIWVESALVNARREGDIAFVNRRKGYVA